MSTGNARSVSQPPRFEPDAPQSHRPRGHVSPKSAVVPELEYKVHQTIDAESRVILDAEVTTGGRHDNQPYLEQLRRVEDRCHCTIQEATADRGYGSAEILKALKAKGAKTYIPLWHGRSGRSSAPLPDEL